MYNDHSIGVVVPAYNEEGLIGDVITGMPRYVDRVYIIDDCSTDGTWEEVLASAQEDVELGDVPPEMVPDHEVSIQGNAQTDGGFTQNEELLMNRAIVTEPIGRVLPIKHISNRGAGGAIKTGYLAALMDNIDVTVTVDGDGQMDLSQMSRLLDPIVEGDADYAKGNRLLYKDFREEMPPFRFVGNAILTFLTKIASGYWKTMDPQNGYTAISFRALDNVGIEGMYEYYGYCNDLLVKLNAKGMRVADVAMPAVYGEEASSIRYSEYIRKVSRMLLWNFLWRLKTRYLVLDFHPLALFYYFGAANVGIGVLLGIWSLTVWFTGDGSLFMRGAMSLMIFTMGSMFIMFAMLFDMQANESMEVQVRE
ncbi:glycosyltransferase family 2 protein [Natronorarus salvus]|uniref:glycosyltransferase family 2 protein n=1 Tax=Natronorarus salvus TaxID=3117733 RepID=UPI002F2678D1